LLKFGIKIFNKGWRKREEINNKTKYLLNWRERRMRDKNRIKLFLDKLELLWINSYDLRFGQIICLLQNKMNKDDIFYPEEEEWTKALDSLLKDYQLL